MTREGEEPKGEHVAVRASQKRLSRDAWRPPRGSVAEQSHRDRDLQVRVATQSHNASRWPLCPAPASPQRELANDVREWWVYQTSIWPRSVWRQIKRCDGSSDAEVHTWRVA